MRTVPLSAHSCPRAAAARSRQEDACHNDEPSPRERRRGANHWRKSFKEKNNTIKYSIPFIESMKQMLKFDGD